MNQSPMLTISKPSTFLCERIYENSNYEIEWLWAASQVTVPEETIYCLERALYINANNRETQDKLYRLITPRSNSWYRIFNLTVTKLIGMDKP
jgi:hypothetical protein